MHLPTPNCLEKNLKQRLDPPSQLHISQHSSLQGLKRIHFERKSQKVLIFLEVHFLESVACCSFCSKPDSLQREDSLKIYHKWMKKKEMVMRIAHDEKLNIISLGQTNQMESKVCPCQKIVKFFCYNSLRGESGMKTELIK